MNARAARPELAEIRALFSRRSLWQAWLDVEATLAEVQAELGVIPQAAADEIRSKASLEALDEPALAADIERTRAPILSLARTLGSACAGDAGGYVHWGATTQNVLQTGRTLLMRRAHDAFMCRLGDTLEILADLAESSADTLTVGRTNYRHALPITFGFKVAGWIDELLRHRDRLVDAEPRVFLSLWGGALGAMHAFGEAGPEINRRLSQRLGLMPMAIPTRAGTDHIAEYVMLLALFSATCSKIARELYSLMADEYAEVYEELGDAVVGSSTMPHKVNSKVAVEVIAIAARLRSQVPLALDAMQPTHEGDTANNLMLYGLMDSICPLAYELVCGMNELLDCIVVVPEQMRRNLDRSASFITAENAMMVLAPTLGRNPAHDLLHHAIAEAATDGKTLAEILLRDADVRAAVSSPALAEALDPARYTGRSSIMAREMAATARQAAHELQQRGSA
ncbi:MAG: adenylosuccinate lyase family protein [Betaproteobacteria bacterium]|nr:MAG: adenylosuccinate lyase family protein [Betaproteobacteria bacterium]